MHLPLSRNYVIMVTMFFAVSVINNYSLNFNIAMPLHMIFRSVRVDPPPPDVGSVGHLDLSLISD